MLGKLIPIAIIGIIGVKGFTMAQDQMDFFSNYTKISATQRELANIKKMLVLEQSYNGNLPEGDDWKEVVREQTNARGRDPVIDLWENEYMYEPYDEDFCVYSAGPDGDYDSEDDIVNHQQGSYSEGSTYDTFGD